MKKLATFFSFLTVALLPVVTFAQGARPSGTLSGGGQIRNLDNVIDRVLSAFNIAIYILISLSVVYLVWTIVKYFIMEPGEEKQAHLGKVGYALLGLFIILSIWGLVNILVTTFNTGTNDIGDQNRLPYINN